MGFLSDCKLLNTAITRARFRLVIIGDPVALCSIGECRVCFKMILGRCNSNKTFHYRLAFEMVIKMTKDAKSERESKQVQKQGPTALSTPTRNNPSYIAPVFPRGPMPGNQRSVPFVQEGPPLGNYGPFSGRPSIFIHPKVHFTCKDNLFLCPCILFRSLEIPLSNTHRLVLCLRLFCHSR